MRMSKKSLFCIAVTQQHADFIVDCLRHEGFWSDHVSALIPHSKSPSDFVLKVPLQSRDHFLRTTGSSALVGEALSWLAGIGALIIPGFGLFTATGSILAALSGAALGMAFSGLTGGLARLGLAEPEASRLAGRIKSGKILLAVQAHDPETMKTAEHILKDSGAEDLCIVSTDSPCVGLLPQVHPE